MSVTQTGCCLANVSLTNDTVPGNVTVKEGWANNDRIYLSGDNFGHTVLAQQQGAHPVGKKDCDGNGDTITVLKSKVADLTVTQVSGADNCVTIDGLGVVKDINGLNFGVIITPCATRLTCDPVVPPTLSGSAFAGSKKYGPVRR
jgi:hypothetical protein